MYCVRAVQSITSGALAEWPNAVPCYGLQLSIEAFPSGACVVSRITRTFHKFQHLTTSPANHTGVVSILFGFFFWILFLYPCPILWCFRVIRPRDSPVVAKLAYCFTPHLWRSEPFSAWALYYVQYSTIHRSFLTSRTTMALFCFLFISISPTFVN